MGQAGIINIADAGGGGGIKTINGDVGSVTGTTVTFESQAGESVSFQGSSTIMVFEVEDANSNIYLGNGAGGVGAAVNNTGVGSDVFDDITSGSNSVAFGYNALSLLNTGSNNTCLGYEAGVAITSGSYNTLIGQQAGLNYSTSSSSNILLGNTGTIGESNVMRLGTTGSGNGQVNKAFVAGIQGSTVDTATVVGISGDQLATTTLTGGANITITHAAGVITFTGTVGNNLKITTPGAYPYATLATDTVILVDTSVARTINLIGPPATGQHYYIKDNVGSAAANNITVVPNAGNIDGVASKTMNVNYGCMELVYNGTQWNII